MQHGNVPTVLVLLVGLTTFMNGGGSTCDLLHVYVYILIRGVLL
jgi:hypothetical protein